MFAIAIAKANPRPKPIRSRQARAAPLERDAVEAVVEIMREAKRRVPLRELAEQLAAGSLDPGALAGAIQTVELGFVRFRASLLLGWAAGGRAAIHTLPKAIQARTTRKGPDLQRES